MMVRKGFGDKWCDWVLKTVKGEKVAIKTNDVVGPYFRTHKKVFDKVTLFLHYFLILLQMGLLA
jgi:hypothetical protein